METCRNAFAKPGVRENVRAEAAQSGSVSMAEVRLVNVKKIYPFVSGEEKKKKNGGILNDDGKLTVYVGNSARKTKMIPILRDLVMGVRRKERGIRVFECSEAEIHLARPLAVHVDGESCMCQENLAVRCIPKRMRVIGS